MEVNKQILIGELKEKIGSESFPEESADVVVDTLFELMKNHVQKGDKISLQEFSVYRKGSSRHSKSGKSSRSRSGKSHKSSRHETKFYSSNYVINELSLMFHDLSYFLRKTYYFTRKIAAVVAVILLYYAVTVLVGC